MTQETITEEKYWQMSRQKTHELRALMKGLSEEKRIFKKTKKANVKNHALLCVLRERLYYLHLLYGMVRGNTFQEVTQSFTSYKRFKHYTANQEMRKLFSFYFSTYYFDVRERKYFHPDVDQEAQNVKHREKTHITPYDIALWLSEKDIRLFRKYSEGHDVKIKTNHCIGGSVSLRHDRDDVCEVRTLSRNAKATSTTCVPTK